jgi:hypothetical protein
VNQTLAPERDSFGEEVCVEITDYKQALKEKHARRPQRGRAAEPGKEEFCEYELNLKQQKSTNQHGNGVRPGAR